MGNLHNAVKNIFISRLAQKKGIHRASFQPVLVHPRLRGEHTKFFLVLNQELTNIVKSYRFNYAFLRPQKQHHYIAIMSKNTYLESNFFSFSSGFKNDTSFIPSKSIGIRLFLPTVSKSKPDSVFVLHIITALPS